MKYKQGSLWLSKFPPNKFLLNLVVHEFKTSPSDIEGQIDENFQIYISTTYCDFRGSRRAVTTPLPWASERSPSSVAMLVSTQQVLATASSRESANRWIKVSTPFRLLTSLQGSSMKIVNRFLLSN